MADLELPEGWINAVVGDYIYLKNGYAFKSNSYVPPGDQTFPVIRISDLDGQDATDLDAMHVETGADGFEVKKGDLLIAMSGATTGKLGVYIGKEPAYQNQRVGNLKLNSEKYGCSNFKNYLISALSDQILKAAYGGAQPNISGKAIEEMEVQLPPLAEQKVIAEKLETLLAQVETTKARLERIPQLLKRFRQSVLETAVSGKLTDSLVEQRKLTDFVKFRQGTQVPSENQVNSEIVGYERFLRIINFTQNSNEFTYVPNSESNRRITENDIVMVRYGATSGFVGRGLTGVLANNLFVISPNEIKLSKDYLYCFLNSPEFQGALTQMVKGGAMPAISFKLFDEININLPSIESQTEIVHRVEQFFALANTIEQKANAALERVNNLTQSILAKAFNGELTAHWRAANPDLISGENSAEALLKKIKLEREAQSSTGKKRKTST